MGPPTNLSRRDALALLAALPLAPVACARPAPATSPSAPADDPLTRLAAEYESLMGDHGFAEWSRYAGEADPKRDAGAQMAALRAQEEGVVRRAAALAAKAGGRSRREVLLWDRAARGFDLLGDARAIALADELEAIINDFAFSIGGKRVSRGELRRMARGEDAAARREQRRAFGALHAKAVPTARALLRRRRDLAREKGLASGFYDTLLALRGVAPGRLRALLSALEERTRAPYQSAIADARAATKLTHVGPWDLAYLAKSLGDAPDERFPKEGAIPFARGVFGALGVDLDRPMIRIDVRDFAFGGQTISLRIPDDVRAVVNPSPGARFYGTLLHELGHAFAATHTRVAEPALRGYEWCAGMTEPAYDEGIAEVFGGVLDEGAILARLRPELPAAERERFLAGRARAALIGVRQALATIELERAALADPDQDLDALERKLDREIVGVESGDDVEAIWATSPFLATYPVYTQSYTLAAMFSHQVRAALRKRFGADWAKPAAGAFLADTLAADAAATTTDEKLVRATGAPLGVDAYVAWLTGAG